MGKRSIGNYFSFRWMITPDIIKILYVLGMILLNLGMIAATLSGAASVFLVLDNWVDLDTVFLVLIAVGVVIVGFILGIIFNLILRMMCEQIILFFSIHETLVSVEETSKDILKEEKKASRRPPAPAAPPPQR